MSFDLKFGENLNPAFFYCEENRTKICDNEIKGNTVTAVTPDITAVLEYKKSESGFSYKIKLSNDKDKDFSPETFGVNLGVDTYLESYPEWNEKFFPTHFRCEETHFWGYFMSPMGKVLAVYTKEPIASYHFDYNGGPIGWGHRINFAGLVFFNAEPLPYHHPKGLSVFKAGEEKEFEIFFEYCENLTQFKKVMTEKYYLPLFDSQKFTLSLGEKIEPNVIANEEYEITVTDSDGNALTDLTPEKEGLYKAYVLTKSGKKATACYFIRKSWKWYMESARKAVVEKPPHATTHCESWYGFFTGFLAAKHYPDKELDSIIGAMFDEIMPLAFDFKKYKPKLIPERIQNVGALISVLVDRYEIDPQNNKDSLMLASHFADWIIKRQRSDGAYYRENTHYTCVIYPAKSMLELADAEEKCGKSDEYFKNAAIRHRNSAKNAIDDLVENLEDIGTEGEHTLEDGMISCSSLQIACYALSLPEDKRKKYIDAAEHMLKVHRCLEQQLSPDCRARGTTVRYWEAQYDVMIMRNFITSPHGWSAWLLYALYYLYLLTGKEEYLTQLMDGMGACAQLLSLDGDLRWAFVVDPYAYCERVLKKDENQPVHDGYKSVVAKENACRGLFGEGIFGEEYIDMVSGWYRTCKSQKVTGGYYTCPLFLEGGETIRVDRQGGCCDNDVHEIFKCLEETVLKKSFVHEKADGSFLCYSCKAERNGDSIDITLLEETEILVCNLTSDSKVSVTGKEFSVNKGIRTIDL